MDSQTVRRLIKKLTDESVQWIDADEFGLQLAGEWIAKALENSKKIQQQKLKAPLVQLRYQRDLINSKRDVQKLYRELATAKLQLAALMNLPPGEDYELVIPDRNGALPEVDMRLEDMELRALLNRSELRTVDYRKRINAKETKAAILELLPNLTFEVGKNHNSNTFLFHQNWLTYSARVSWNLLNLFRHPIKLKTIGAQKKVLEAQSLALTMTVVSQVHVGAAQLAFAKEQLMTAKSYYDTQGQITEQTRLTWLLNRLDEQTMISEKVNQVVALLRYDTARANVEFAYAGLLATMGEDPLPVSVTDRSVAELAAALKARWNSSLPPSKLTTRQRLAIVLSVLRGERSVAEAAREHGLTVTEVEEWKRRVLLGAGGAPQAQAVDGKVLKDKQIR